MPVDLWVTSPHSDLWAVAGFSFQLEGTLSTSVDNFLRTDDPRHSGTIVTFLEPTMAGLIPLMLGSGSSSSSGSRASYIAPSQTGSRASYIAPSQTIRRRQSALPASTSPTTPTYAARPKFPKRLSLPTPVTISMLPYTQAEWRKTIGEVKRKYFGKRYRACSARCLEVLDGIKDTSQVEPVYLIYLHFYAATSLEICARPLPSTAALRASLLQQARTHFDRASALINAAEESVLQKFRPGSGGSSRASSCHSPSGSVSSRAWTPDTRVSSPTDSLCSFDDLSPKSHQSLSPQKRVKKVSFSLPKEASFHMTTEPIIRPDSPTLGFDDFFQPSAAMQQQQEEPPVLLVGPTPKFHEIELPLQTIPEHVGTEEQQPQQHQEDDDEAETENEDTYLTARSVDRCCEHLSSLRTQLARHSTSLDQLLSISSSTNPPQSPNPSSSSSPTIPARGEAARAADRQARIERLRKTGWQRKRFDASRYEELCEAVLAELE
jgi:hypothetical protein